VLPIVTIPSTSRPRYCEVTPKEEHGAGRYQQRVCVIAGNFCVVCPILLTAAARSRAKAPNFEGRHGLAACVLLRLQLQNGVTMNTKIASIDSGARRRKATLKSKLEDLLRSGGDREGLEIEQTADPLDQVRSSTDREMAVETLNQRARSIHDIQSALARIEDGSYGLCERCEEQIPAKRLDAIPWARLCVKCQSAMEAEPHAGKKLFDTAA
jgi:DnaK suppressor protein